VDPPPHRPVRDVGGLSRKSALELAQYAKSDVQLEASIGMAALNSLLKIDEDRCDEVNAIEVLIEGGKGKKVAVIGHFPFIPALREAAAQLWVLEKKPRAEEDLPADRADEIVPLADVVCITGTSFINHTVEHLLGLCRRDALVVMVGATTPMSTILFDWGVDLVAGAKVADPTLALRCIAEGASFRQIKGVKRLVFKKQQ
jgi:uncharacterized protein (DUF4213/DUF364 family)